MTSGFRRKTSRARLLGAIGVVSVMIAISCDAPSDQPPRVSRSSPVTTPKIEETTAPTMEQKTKKGFFANVPANLASPEEPVAKRMLREYGAMFVADAGAKLPSKVVFNNEEEVSTWQSGVPVSQITIGGIEVELQEPAAKALSSAIDEASAAGLSITPRGGTDAARRNYEGTVSNWKSRVEPNLEHYVDENKISSTEAERIKSMSIPEQIEAVFELEDRGLWFSTRRDKSIIYSVAPPGTSQHISMLALDVAEFDQQAVRAVLARHGWFRTVLSDQPHFTFLGRQESDLPEVGLKKKLHAGDEYWVPDL